MTEMTKEEQTIFDKEIRGVSGRILWQFFAGWTSLVCFVLFTYYSLKNSIEDSNAMQSKTDAIQDMRLNHKSRQYINQKHCQKQI